MSCPNESDEDQVEKEVVFISEGPVHQVLECVDLLSDSEEEEIDDEIDRRKAHVASTLDRLAQKVAEEKQERANKCREFKEKQVSQKTHGQQLSFSPINGDAKRCVDMWLKMPGVRPGVINSGFGRRNLPLSFPVNSTAKRTCPVVNCGRVYDNVPLLEGHLKRFDHSPCDPAIHLKGSPSQLFACVACGHHFIDKAAWKVHLQSKVSSTQAEGHSITQNCQIIVCFACPACCLLFNLKEECLQHMAANNHFTDSMATNSATGRAVPIPIPHYAKSHLIALCKDVVFNVRCTMCRKVLNSHKVAQAHFNVNCRHGCAIAEAEQTVAQVMKQLRVRGQCHRCCKTFLNHAELERHKEVTGHDVEVNRSAKVAILQYCSLAESQEKRLSAASVAPRQKRVGGAKGATASPAKRRRAGLGASGGRSSVAWACECGLVFPEEAAATSHLLAVNQVFHQCGVCGKLMGESVIAHLHMSRFHGGAHLSNFLYHCRLCKVDMPRFEDILSHVSEAHGGHTYIAEREVPWEAADTKPSTRPSSTASTSFAQPSTSLPQPSAASSAPPQAWMCRMCEDIFESEAAVAEHCADANAHSFQRFVCGHCPQRFFKESTVRRHCADEHGGQLRHAYFCGLCDSMTLDNQEAFAEHYSSLHSKDYYCITEGDAGDGPPAAETPGRSECPCPCMASEKCKEERKATYTRCVRKLSADGKCRYTCAPCGLTVSSFPHIKTHVYTKHAALNLGKTFDVECTVCPKSFLDVPAFHKHYHDHHCPLEPCVSSSRTDEGYLNMATVLDDVEIKSDDDDDDDDDEVEDVKLTEILCSEKANKDDYVQEGKLCDSDEELKCALVLSAEEAKASTELEEVLQRSLLEY